MGRVSDPTVARSHEQAVWFLDVDGVVSPYGNSKRWTGPTLLGGPIDSDLAVPYRPEVIARIQEAHASGMAEVRWLTTWDEEALADWERVGLGPFQVAPRPSGGDRSRWKFRVVTAWLARHPTRRAVWTDDDPMPPQVRDLDAGRLLAIEPDHTVGLTLEHLSSIMRWLRQS